MIEKLQKLGLSNKEAEIYMVLTKLGEASANEIAKRNSINRTVTYNVLEQLIEKGIVNFINKGSKRFYKISNPESLLSSIKEKEILAQKLIKEIKDIKPEKRNSSNVETYEGLESLKAIFDEIKKARDLFVLNATGKIFEKLIYTAPHVTDEILKINPKQIAVNSMKNTDLAKKSNPKFTKFLPKEADNYATTFIFDGKIIIVVLKEKPLMIRIENKEIYEGYKKDFNILWDKL